MNTRRILSEMSIDSLAIIVVAATAFISCSDGGSSLPRSADNGAIIQISQNEFTYTIDARHYTAEDNYELFFCTNSVTYALVVANHSSGNAIVTVTDDFGGTIRKDSILTNMNVLTNVFDGPFPAHCTVKHNNFSGQITFTCTENIPAPN